MLSVVVAVCVVVAVSAHGGMQPMQGWGQMNQMNQMNQMQGMQNWMNQMGQGSGMNNMGNGMNNMGNGMNQNMGQGMNNMGQGMNNMGQGMNQNMGQNMNSNQNIMSMVMMMLLNQMGGGRQQNMGGNNGGNNGDNDGMSERDMEEVENMMKYKMMTEMADMMMMYMEYKKTEKEFGNAMEALCFMVNATWEAAKMGNTTPFNQTTDAWMDQQEENMEGWSERQIMEYLVNMMQTNEQMYGEVFFRMATWACVAGHDYMKAATMMDKSYREM